jgi:hypothetical protein
MYKKIILVSYLILTPINVFIFYRSMMGQHSAIINGKELVSLDQWPGMLLDMAISPLVFSLPVLYAAYYYRKRSKQTGKNFWGY